MMNRLNSMQYLLKVDQNDKIKIETIFSSVTWDRGYIPS